MEYSKSGTSMEDMIYVPKKNQAKTRKVDGGVVTPAVNPARLRVRNPNIKPLPTRIAKGNKFPTGAKKVVPLLRKRK